MKACKNYSAAQSLAVFYSGTSQPARAPLRSQPTASPLRPQLVRSMPTASLPMASLLARAMLRRQLASETRRGRNFMRTSEP